MAVGGAEPQLPHSPRLIARGVQHLGPRSYRSVVERVNIIDTEIRDVAVITQLAGGGHAGAAAEHERDGARATKSPIAWGNVVEFAPEDIPVPRTGPFQVMNR